MLMTVRRPRRLFLFAAAALAACTQSTTLCGCSPVVPYAVIQGAVTDPDGARVHRAEVSVQMASPTCEGFATGGPQYTNETGDYRLHVPHANAPEPLCIRLVALPPSGSTLRMSDTAQFTIPFSATLPPDTVRRSLQLKAPAS